MKPCGGLKKRLEALAEGKWCIPSVGAEFVYHMEDVLDLYEEPYEPQFSVVTFDELPYHLTDEVRLPLPARAGQPERYDYE